MAFTQARVWQLTNGTRLYGAPPEFEEADLDVGSVFQKAADEVAARGHDLVEAALGKQTGHLCLGCKAFHAKKNFNKWPTGDVCLKQASGRERKAAFELRHNVQAKAARLAKENYQIFETDSEDELPGPEV